MRKLSLALVTLALQLGLLSPAVADEHLTFTGVFTPVVTSTSLLDSTHELIVFTVPAQATVLGTAQGSADAILDLSDLTYVGVYWWPNANGDAIYGSFLGEFVPTQTAGLYNNVEQVFIEGGRGKLAGATGFCAAGGQLDAVDLTAPAPWPFYGTIFLPGSKK